MISSKRFIYGFGGCGQEVKNILIRQNIKDIRFFDDKKILQKQNKVLNFKNFIKSVKKEKINVFLAIQNPLIRKKIFSSIKSNVNFQNLVDKNSVFFENIKIKMGSIIWPNTTISTNVNIGKFFQMNLNSFIGHDCKIGDFVTFSPSVNCCGGVKIGNDVLIGTSATLLPGVKIGNNVTISPGSIVYDNIPSNTTVFGNPAKVILKR